MSFSEISIYLVKPDKTNEFETARNRDIVAVALGDEATLKRFMQMGDTILLVPKNANYEPIQVRSDQINVLGKVIGVLKKQ